MCTFLDLDRIASISCIMLILLFKKNSLNLICIFHDNFQYTCFNPAVINQGRLVKKLRMKEIVSQIIGISEVCDQSGVRATKSSKSCNIYSLQLKPSFCKI